MRKLFGWVMAFAGLYIFTGGNGVPSANDKIVALLLAAAGLWLALGKGHEGEKAPKPKSDPSPASDSLTDHYWKMEKNIMKEVWNEESKTVDWKAWFDHEYDLTAGGAPAEVLQALDRDFRNCGKAQIELINSRIKYYFLYDPSHWDAGFEAMKNQIFIPGINVNLRNMFSFRNGEMSKGPVPGIVTDYQEKLKIFGYPYDKSQITEEKCRQIIALGEHICSTC